MLRFDVVRLLLVSAIDHCRLSLSRVSRAIVSPGEPRVVGGPFQTRRGDESHNQNPPKCRLSAVKTENKSDRSTWQTVTSKLARSIGENVASRHNNLPK